MSYSVRWPRSLLISTVAAAQGQSFAQAAVQKPDIQKPYIKADLVTGDSEAGGREFWIGVRLNLGSGRKTYWKSLGDAGLPDRATGDMETHKPAIEALLVCNNEQAEAFDFQGTPAFIVGTFKVPGVLDAAGFNRPSPMRGQPRARRSSVAEGGGQILPRQRTGRRHPLPSRQRVTPELVFGRAFASIRKSNGRTGFAAFPDTGPQSLWCVGALPCACAMRVNG